MYIANNSFWQKVNQIPKAPLFYMLYWLYIGVQHYSAQKLVRNWSPNKDKLWSNIDMDYESLLQ